MGNLKELLPGIRTWAKFSDEKQMDFNGHAVRLDSDPDPAWILIDPPQPDPDTLEALKALGRIRAIVLTNKDHRRDSESLRKEFSAPVWGPKADADLFDIRLDREYEDGEILFGRLRVIGLSHLKSPGESALHDPKTQSLIIGDAVIGKISGKLNLLPAEKIPDPGKAKESLRALLDLEFEHLLIGDGTSILTTGKAALADFLK